MNAHTITAEQIARYGEHLREEERAPGTVENYLRNVDRFVFWLAGRAVTREKAVEWKEHLVSCRYAPATINGMLSALNSFFSYFGWQECRVKALRVQRRAFRDPSRELTREEYEHLIETARLLGRERLALVLETIGATGVRVSEVRYLTVEAARSGRAEISLKGKIRTILLPGKLCRKLLKYARKEKIASGEVFRVQTCTLHALVVDSKAERLDQMQHTACRRTGAGNVAGVLRNLRLDQNNVEHTFASFTN